MMSARSAVVFSGFQAFRIGAFAALRPSVKNSGSFGSSVLRFLRYLL
jgi:hypothetical protein